MFYGGIATYLVSKEIYVLEHEYYTGVSILIMFVYGVKKFGPRIAAYLDKQIDEEEAELAAIRTDQIAECENAIANEKKQQWRSEVQQLILDAKKENVLMQLEATYRERLANVAAEVKYCLTIPQSGKSISLKIPNFSSETLKILESV